MSLQPWYDSIPLLQNSMGPNSACCVSQGAGTSVEQEHTCAHPPVDVMSSGRPSLHSISRRGQPQRAGEITNTRRFLMGGCCQGVEALWGSWGWCWLYFFPRDLPKLKTQSRKRSPFWNAVFAKSLPISLPKLCVIKTVQLLRDNKKLRERC